MCRCIVRVELHNYATEAQYQTLHRLMAAQGMVQYIVSDTGQKVRLPPAEYYYNGLADVGTVRSAAKACAASVVTKSAVLVTEATGAILWEGLQAA